MITGSQSTIIHTYLCLDYSYRTATVQRCVLYPQRGMNIDEWDPCQVVVGDRLPDVDDLISYDLTVADEVEHDVTDLHDALSAEAFRLARADGYDPHEVSFADNTGLGDTDLISCEVEHPWEPPTLDEAEARLRKSLATGVLKHEFYFYDGEPLDVSDDGIVYCDEADEVGFEVSTQRIAIGEVPGLYAELTARAATDEVV